MNQLTLEINKQSMPRDTATKDIDHFRYKNPVLKQAAKSVNEDSEDDFSTYNDMTTNQLISSRETKE
jgi:hypothetical protein